MVHTNGFTGELPPRRFNLARYCLEDAARRHPGKPALIVAPSDDPAAAERWSYGALEDAVLRMAEGFRLEGLLPGSRIFIRMGNSAEYALVFFGAIAAGLVPIPASSQLSLPEVGFLLADAEVQAVAHAGDLPLPELPPGVRRLGRETLDGFRCAPRGGYADTERDHPAFLIYTSGTSGGPKGVLHAQRAAWGRRPMVHGWYGLGSDDVVLHTGAFNWTYTLGTGMFDPWASGATSVLYTGAKDPRVWPALARAFEATILASVPTLYRQMLKYGDLTPARFGRLRHGLTAGEAMPVQLLEEWRRTTGRELYEALGMSEISTYISSAPGVPIRPGSPGRPQPGRCVAILPVADGSEPLPAGEVGLLAVHRSDPGLMLGYWRRPEEEAQVFRGDWFCGGDLARMDRDGYVWFEGRNDDVMNPMGYRVSPLEVEAVLAAHPAVGEVGPRQDVSIIAAFVVPAAGATLDADELLAFAAGRLARYKQPRQVVIVESLPRTANGKVMRKALAKLLPSLRDK